MRAARSARPLPLAALSVLAALTVVAPETHAAAPADSTEPPQDAHVAALIDAARRAELSRHPHWRTLVHYKGGLSGLRSLVDDPRFFLAENGKHDPQAELEATIRAFFRPVAENEEHPICRFVARFEWLRETLAIDTSRLPLPGCPRFAQLMEEIRPESATLIFPTSHMNSPASMYGHTLLTIRTAFASDLLNYAVNYSAVTDETFGPLYILKGLLGDYKGYFSILPYYAKLQEYSDVDDRDIWEYPLDLSTEEVRRLLMHVYELQNIYSDYFFFSENCSYDLLFLLDAARPGLDLTDRCAWWVIPLDTIREVKRAGLVREALHRPSRSTKIKHLAALVGKRGRRDALGIARGDVDPEALATRDSARAETAGAGDAAVAWRAAVLDLASESLQYRYAKKEIAKATYQERFVRTLGARSRLGGPGDDASRRIPAPDRPDEGHHSNRASVGVGVDDERLFQEVRLRPAYHGLLDDDAGYKRGSQIVFAEIALRYEPGTGALRLASLDLIDIVSLAPRDDFFKHTSWKVRTDLFRRALRGGDYLVYRLNPGFGFTHESRLLGLCYALIETDLHVGGALDGSYSLGAGGTIGAVGNVTRWWKVQAFASDIYHGLGDSDNLVTVGLGQNLRVGADVSVAFEIAGRAGDHDDVLESVVRWNVFF